MEEWEIISTGNQGMLFSLRHTTNNCKNHHIWSDNIKDPGKECCDMCNKKIPEITLFQMRLLYSR